MSKTIARAFITAIPGASAAASLPMAHSDSNHEKHKGAHRIMFSKLHFALLVAAFTFVAWPVTPTAAAPTAVRKGASSAKTFKVGGRTLTGVPKTICVIEGKWADGEFFRYEAWDRCADMSMRRTSHAEFKDEESYGEEGPEIKDIPAKAEVIEVSNDSSTVLLFRDRKGIMREIMTSD